MKPERQTARSAIPPRASVSPGACKSGGGGSRWISFRSVLRGKAARCTALPSPDPSSCGLRAWAGGPDLARGRFCPPPGVPAGPRGAPTSPGGGDPTRKAPVPAPRFPSDEHHEKRKRFGLRVPKRKTTPKAPGRGAAAAPPPVPGGHGGGTLRPRPGPKLSSTTMGAWSLPKVVSMLGDLIFSIFNFF